MCVGNYIADGIGVLEPAKQIRMWVRVVGHVEYYRRIPRTSGFGSDSIGISYGSELRFANECNSTMAVPGDTGIAQERSL